MTRSHRRYWRDRRGLAVGLVILALLLTWRWIASSNARSGPERLEEGYYEVRDIVDGDTLVLASGAHVRLQGIDTGESVRTDAAEAVEDFVNRAGRRVRLTFGLERKDHRDHFLAFVWHGSTMLNEELVRAGLARARLEYRHSGLMTRRLAAAQDDARRAGRGIWSEKETGPTTAVPR